MEFRHDAMPRRISADGQGFRLLLEVLLSRYDQPPPLLATPAYGRFGQSQNIISMLRRKAADARWQARLSIPDTITLKQIISLSFAAGH